MGSPGVDKIMGMNGEWLAVVVNNCFGALHGRIGLNRVGKLVVHVREERSKWVEVRSDPGLWEFNKNRIRGRPTMYTLQRPGRDRAKRGQRVQDQYIILHMNMKGNHVIHRWTNETAITDIKGTWLYTILHCLKHILTGRSFIVTHLNDRKQWTGLSHEDCLKL